MLSVEIRERNKDPMQEYNVRMLDLTSDRKQWAPMLMHYFPFVAHVKQIIN